MTRLALLLAATLMAGCTASGELDPLAYTKKPLYTGGFDLARIAGGTDSQEFRVTDGSIAAIIIQVWVNATEGGGRVQIADPSGKVVVDTTGVADERVPLNLGVWTVTVDGEPASAGRVHILATRV